ncbi:unnamed protein product [Peronospora destructor]|uniref:Retroviral polymerase SH3-like domain-containing protein n=1 Tax=Peronospora destructor TaxID=86335 RepID=A0AAV0V6P4_9STRA|nr:unnamed protein product [Peronospora destructor]
MCNRTALARVSIHIPPGPSASAYPLRHRGRSHHHEYGAGYGVCKWVPLKSWGDAAEYAAFILNRSPTKANEDGISLIEMLIKKRPVLNDIAVFGSPCTVHLTTTNKSLGMRGKAAIIIGRNDEMKGYRIYTPKERVVVVTQHVQNVETLTDVQDSKLVNDLNGTEGQEELETKQTSVQLKAVHPNGHVIDT